MSAAMRKKRISEFFHREYKKLVGYVQRQVDQAADRDAEDFVQDVMVNMFDKADLTIPVENLSAYIYRSLRNRVIDYFRKRKKIVSLDAKLTGGQDLSLADLLQDVRSHTASKQEQEELYSRLYAAIDSLEKKERAVIIATDFEGDSFRRLSEAWGVPIGTLLSRKSRALRKIRKKLGDLSLYLG